MRKKLAPNKFSPSRTSLGSRTDSTTVGAT
jgi:hypothetical protein